MAKEAIDAVIRAEQNADRAVAEARLQASKIKEKATLSAKEHKEQVAEEITLQAERMRKKAEDEARATAAPKLAEAERLAGFLENLSDQDLEPAVRHIVDKVVNYGDR